MDSTAGRRPTLREIAHRAGVSLMTVSYAFNNPDRVSDATRERVLAAAAELGYQGKNPWATALRRGRAGALGVVFSEHLTYAFSNPQATDFLAGVASVCAEEGLGLTIIPTVGDAEDAERVAAAPVDGYVFWTTRADDPCLDAAARTHRPCAIQGGPAYDGFVRVGAPDRGVAASIAHLGLSSGQVRHPVVISFSLDTDRVARAGYDLPLAAARLPVTHDRLAGYRDAVTAVGLSWQETYVLALSRNDRGEAQHALSSAIADGVPVDLVLCTSDELALGALDALRENGLAVPDDVSVTGWDDGPGAEAAGLSTVWQSLFEQGRVCGSVAAGLEVTSTSSAWRIVPRSTTRTSVASS
ncbi:LacI family DNA-binding transcriptional regulator [Antribacter gilvus]|uniref:LacI family DNA-binding transcriptional regulator n=1 Tax=Antribacter gilvus TaxID=2304675 RepID=UPI000F7749F3|nr:LacI family DNA-binding transcriptional regulator [Antribacter gilvus]